MIVHGICGCDLCGQYLGQLWNQPAIAPDLLPAPDFHVCDDCWTSSEPVPVRYQISDLVHVQGERFGTDSDRAVG